MKTNFKSISSQTDTNKSIFETNFQEIQQNEGYLKVLHKINEQNQNCAREI